MLTLSVVVSAHVAAQAGKAADSARQAALALEQQGDMAGAEAQWLAVVKAHPSSAEANGHLGLLEARQEHYPEAIRYYRRAMALNPKTPGLRMNLGLSLFKSGDMRGAIGEFEPLLRALPAGSAENQRLTILIGMAHYGLGEYEDASRYLKTAAAADGKNQELLLALAHSCMWSRQYQCVLSTYHQILDLDPDSAEADMLAGEAQDALDNPDGAIEEFRAAAKADPKLPDVHFGLGYLLWKQKQYGEAAEELQAELDNNPKQAQAMMYLGDAEMKLNRGELSGPLFEKALAMEPALELAHLDLGILDAAAGKNDEALRELSAAVKLAPDDPTAHWHMGRLYRAMGRTAEAKAEFERSSSLHQAANDALVNRISGGQVKEDSGGAAPKQ